MRFKLPINVTDQKPDSGFVRFVAQVFGLIQTILNGQIGFIDNCKTSYVTVTFFNANVSQAIPHSLKQTPNGYIVCDNTNVNSVGPTNQSFAGNGTQQYATPTNPSPSYILVEMAGAGGGGGCSGTTDGTAAMAGGDSTFSIHGGAALVTAKGGSAGTRGGPGGSGGSVTSVASSVIKLLQSYGGDGDGAGAQGSAATTATPILPGGLGGNGFLGFGLASGGSSSQAGQLTGARNPNLGGGGGGAACPATSNAKAGSGGGAGAYQRFQINNPSAVYDLVLGSGGSGQTAGGGGGSAGGSAGDGFCYITEFYATSGVVVRDKTKQSNSQYIYLQASVAGTYKILIF